MFDIHASVGLFTSYLEGSLEVVDKSHKMYGLLVHSIYSDEMFHKTLLHNVNDLHASLLKTKGCGFRPYGLDL